MSATATREKTIKLRVTGAQKSFIKRAADAAGETYTAFMLDASMERAGSVLADRPRFEWPAAQMERFLAALDAPLSAPEAVRELLARKPQWTR